MPELKTRFLRFTSAKDVFLAELSGSIDASTVNKFRADLEKARKQGIKKLVLDVSGIKYVNSTGLGILVKYADAFRSAGGGLILLKVPPKMKIVIEMLGLHEFFDMYSTPREALKRLSPAVAKPISPKTAEAKTVSTSGMKETSTQKSIPVAKPVAPPTAKPPPTPTTRPPSRPRVASPRGYPTLVTCATCGVDIELTAAGSYKCPRCSTFLFADNTGNINFYGIKKPIPLQLVLVSDEVSTEALKQFVGTVAEKSGFDTATTDAIKSATEEVANIISSKIYNNKGNTYSVLVIPEPKGLTIKFADHGELLPTDAERKLFPQASLAFEEFEITPHAKGGNIITLFKKK